MAEIVKQQIRKFEQIAKPYLYEGPLQSQWSFIEAKTRVKREQITLGLFLSIGILYLAFGWGNDFLSNLIGFLYPAYVSLNSIQAELSDYDTNWLVYWVVFSFVGLIEYILHDFVHSLLFYWLGKTIFLVWLMLPGPNGGSNMLYQRVLAPLVRRGHSTSSSKNSNGSSYSPSSDTGYSSVVNS